MPLPREVLIQRLDDMSYNRRVDHLEEPDGGHEAVAAILSEAADALRGGSLAAMGHAASGLFHMLIERERELAALLHYSPNPAELEDLGLLHATIKKEVERAARTLANLDGLSVQQWTAREKARG